MLVGKFALLYSSWACSAKKFSRSSCKILNFILLWSIYLLRTELFITNCNARLAILQSKLSAMPPNIIMLFLVYFHFLVILQYYASHRYFSVHSQDSPRVQFAPDLNKRLVFTISWFWDYLSSVFHLGKHELAYDSSVAFLVNLLWYVGDFWLSFMSFLADLSCCYECFLMIFCCISFQNYLFFFNSINNRYVSSFPSRFCDLY